MDKKVAIIILVYNGKNYLPDLFSSLEKVIYTADFFRIVAVDNASTDGSAEWIREYCRGKEGRYQTIFNQVNLGFAAGNNVGLKWALENNYDYIYLLNQDTEVAPEFLAEAVKLAESNQKIGAVQSRLMLYPEKEQINSVGNEIHFLGFGFGGGEKVSVENYPLKVDREITYASGAGSLWRASALREVGLFNEEFFMYHEDLDLCWRLRLAGYEIMLAWNSVVYHKYEFNRSIKKYYFMERNRYLTIMQNYRTDTLILVMPALLLMSLGMFFYSFFTGWWRGNLRAYKYIFNRNNLRKMLATRKEVQAKRKAKDIDIIKYFTGRIEFQDIDNPILKYIANPIFDLYWQIIRLVIVW